MYLLHRMSWYIGRISDTLVHGGDSTVERSDRGDCPTPSCFSLRPAPLTCISIFESLAIFPFFAYISNSPLIENEDVFNCTVPYGVERWVKAAILSYAGGKAIWGLPGPIPHCRLGSSDVRGMPHCIGVFVVVRPSKLVHE
jgi:hypothetical protein